MQRASPGALPLRRNHDFVLLQVGQLLSGFGSNLSRLGYPLLTLAVTHSAVAAGYVSAMLFVPVLLLGLGAGVAADRFDRRRLMVGSDAVAALAVASLAVAAATGAARLWLILLVAFLDASTGALFRAGQSGALRAVVPTQQIAAATSVVQGRLAAIRLGAPAVGGALFGAASWLPFVGDAVSYGCSSASLLRMRTRFQQDRAKDPAPLRRQLADGIAHFRDIPFLRTTISMIGVSNFSVTGMQLALIVLAERHGLAGAAVGALVALSGAASLLGSLAAGPLQRRMPMRRILLGEYWAAIGFVAFLVEPSVYVLAAAFAAQSFWFPNSDAAVAAYTYALVPDRLIGRVLSVSDTVRVAAAPLGPLVAGALLSSAPPRVTVAVLAGTTLAAGVVGTLSPSVRTVPPLEEVTR